MDVYGVAGAATAAVTTYLAGVAHGVIDQANADVVRRVYDLVAERLLAGQPGAAALRSLRDDPADLTRQEALRLAIVHAATTDASWASRLAAEVPAGPRIIQAAQEAGSQHAIQLDRTVVQGRAVVATGDVDQSRSWRSGGGALPAVIAAVLLLVLAGGGVYLLVTDDNSSPSGAQPGGAAATGPAPTDGAGRDGASTGADPTGTAPETGAGTVWLYQLPATVEAAGPSGTQVATTVDGQAYPNSTSFWVGCDSVPAVTTFRLGGGFAQLRTRLALDADTPAGLAVTVTLSADATGLGSWTLRPGDTTPVEVPLAGRSELTLSAMATAGVCGASSVGYGIAADAALS